MLSCLILRLPIPANREGEIMRERLFVGLVLPFILLPATSCSWLSVEEDAWIAPSFIKDQYVATRAAAELPDTNDFLMTVLKSDGSVVYSGTYGQSPETIKVSAGTYTVRVVSEEFSKPVFDKAQYGDEQTVAVTSGGLFKVGLLCRQMNAGMRLNVSPTFLTAYPKGLLYLKSGEGKLLWTYRETRIAYFKPGQVSLLLNDSSSEKVLLTRTLMSQDVLTINVSALTPSDTQKQEGGVTISVDTTRNWISDSFVIGGGGAGDDSDNALSVSEARSRAGETGVWVCGFIVGGDLTSSDSGISFEAPFSSSTNIAIASRSNVSSKSSCLSVQLPSGAMREALNLASNPSNLGKKLYLKGDIVSAYYGIPGIKNISDYILK